MGRRDRVRAARRLRPVDVREQRHPPVARRAPGRRHLAAGLAAVVGQRAAPGRLAEGAPQAAPRMAAATRARGRCGSSGRRRRARPTPRSGPRWATAIDYYFVYGPELDDVVAGYRELTGKAPLMPRLALGFWQSRERYRTAKESDRHARRVPEARHPDRHDRAGLAVLAARPVGLAPVRPRALPRSRGLDQARSTSAGTRS